MNINLREKIENTVGQHRALYQKLHEETTHMVTDPVISARLLKVYSPEGAAAELQRQIDALVVKQKATDKLHNAKVVEAVANAKEAAVPDEARSFDRPDDYQQQISNALAFLSLEGDELTDANAYPILKPFFNDWEQMHLFERAIIKQMHFDGESGQQVYSAREKFPQSLGTVLNKADTFLALFGEAEALAETMFIADMKSDTSARFGDYAAFGGYGSESYGAMWAQDRLIELADLIDRYCNGDFVYSAADLKYNRVQNARMGIQFPDNNAARDDDGLFVWLQGRR